MERFAHFGLGLVGARLVNWCYFFDVLADSQRRGDAGGKFVLFGTSGYGAHGLAGF